MRIGFGKRIGSIYIGISKSINGTTGIVIALIAMLFVIPFYMLYYLIIGIIFGVKKINQATAHWQIYSRVILWVGIILGILLLSVIGKSITHTNRDNASNENAVNIKTPYENSMEANTETTKSDYSYDFEDINGTFEYHDITLELTDKYKYDSNFNIIYCCDDDGIGTISFRIIECSNDESAKKVYEKECKIYEDFNFATKSTFDVNNIEITKINWQLNDSYTNSYLFILNHNIYIIDFSAEISHFKECSIYKYSDAMIKTSTLKNRQPTESKEIAAESTDPLIEEEIEESTELSTDEPTEEETEPEVITHDYVINYNTGKFHLPSCYTIKDADNLGDYNGTKDELIDQGYVACKKCKPY